MRRNRTPFRRFLPMDTDVASMIQIVAIIIALVIVMVSIVFFSDRIMYGEHIEQ